MVCRCFALSFLLVVAALLGACASTGPAVNNPDSQEDREKLARARIGDVRVFYFIKPSQGGAGVDGETKPQREVRTTLISHGHTLYTGMPDSQLKDDEYYIWNEYAHDLLVALRDDVRFFEAPGAVNIGDQDPVRRALNDPAVERVIAVEVIRDGKVSCSYLARNWVRPGESLNNEQKTRYLKFNRAQELVVYCIRHALPRGTAARGDGGNIFPRRR